MKKYIFINSLNQESSIIKAYNLEDEMIKMEFKHNNMGLGTIIFEGVKE